MHHGSPDAMLRPSRPMPDVLPSPLRALLAALLIGLWSLPSAGCDSKEDTRETGPQERRLAPAEPRAGRAIDPELPLDVRLLGIEPALHVDQDRVCDVQIAGRPVRLSVADRQRYPSRPAARRLIQCRAAAGEGWADLVFAPAAASLVATVSAGERIRVHVLSATGGFENKPVLEFVAVLGDLPPIPHERRDFLGLRAGYDFHKIDADDIGKERPCAVAYISAPERLASTNQYPGHPSSHATVVCRHALGDSWVDLAFSEPEAGAFLTLRPGMVATMRIVADRGGVAELPVVRLIAIVPPTIGTRRAAPQTPRWASSLF